MLRIGICDDTAAARENLRLLCLKHFRLEEPEFAGAVTLRWRMPAGQEGALCAALGELLRGAAAVTVSPPHFAPF